MIADPSYKLFQSKRIQHWNHVANKFPQGSAIGKKYHNRMDEIYKFFIPEGLKVIEFGSGYGSLLYKLKPCVGVGVDFSSEMIKISNTRFPNLSFIQDDVMTFSTQERFDVIILSDLINDLFDVQKVLENARRICKPNGKIFINFFNNFWGKPLEVARSLKFATPLLEQNWLAPDDVKNMLYLSEWEVIRKWTDCLFPFKFPIIEPFLNKFLAKLWPAKHFCLTNFIVARPKPFKKTYEKNEPSEPSVSIIIPARNEAGNIPRFFNESLRFGSKTEIIIVEGHSSDNTFETAKAEIEKRSDWSARLFQQTGKGKADAVRLGFEKANGDVLMILDADLTVAPEELKRFYEALVSGHGEFINGVRLVYPMEGKAMRFFNLLGNKFFSLAFSWILDQPIKDTLCGTKVLYKKDYEKICTNRDYFGDFDPFGDFDLIFGASKLGLKIVDIPVRYKDRTYGDTNIQRWKHGFLLLRMVIFAARRIKFI